MISPFARGKFEQSAHHLYFLPPGITGQLEAAQPTVLIGSRGSGKTTLLRALDYRERSSNVSLKGQLDPPFRGKFIGVYAKLSLHPCRTLECLFGSGSPLEGRLFGFYLDALCVHLIGHAVSDLISDGLLLEGAMHREGTVAVTFNQQWAQIARWVGSGDCETIRDVAAVSLSVMHKLETLGQRRVPLESIANDIRIPGFGEYSRPLTQAMQRVCDDAEIPLARPQSAASESESGAWHFKVCLDEAESVSDQQKIVLNTLLRQAESPLFPVISFVSRPPDLSTTLIPGLTIQKADVRQLTLDDSKNPDFLRLAEGVATVRCRDALNDSDSRFSCDTVFGSLSLNELIHRIVRVSEKPAAIRLVDLAQRFLSTWPAATSVGDDPPLPYIEAFLADQLSLDPPDNSPKAARKQQSEEFRKKMVVGYLAICKRLDKEHVPFAFSEMVIGVSDNCIRDFLAQLQSIFELCYQTSNEDDLRQFLSQQVRIEKQEVGIRRSSEEKRDSIPRSGILRPVEIGMLVRGLAYITSYLQTQASSEKGELAERGIFRIDGGTAQERGEATRLIRDAAEAGFLRIVIDESHAEILSGFRVHSSLAPAFNFSYRGAYYEAVLRYSEFQRIRACRDEASLRKAAAGIAERIMTKSDPHPQLFSDQDFEEQPT